MDVQVVHGNPSDEELAALLLVLLRARDQAVRTNAAHRTPGWLATTHRQPAAHPLRWHPRTHH